MPPSQGGRRRFESGRPLHRLAFEVRLGQNDSVKIAVEVVFDQKTRQWCVGMVTSPWIASCGRTPSEAKKMFREAFRAYFDAPRVASRASGKALPQIELLTVA